MFLIPSAPAPLLLMDPSNVVSRDPDVMNGALVFAGTRVPVDLLIQHLAAGDSLEDFLADFPTVEREQAVAYLEMALEQTKVSNARAAW